MRCSIYLASLESPLSLENTETGKSCVKRHFIEVVIAKLQFKDKLKNTRQVRNKKEYFTEGKMAYEDQNYDRTQCALNLIRMTQ